MMHLPRGRDAVLAALDAVAPAITAAAAEADRAGRFPDEVIEAIADAGLFRLWIPHTYGGDELPVPDALEVFEAASRLDGAAGWLITIGTGGGPFAAHMEDVAAREVFGPRRALIAGSGRRSGTAVPVDGGYRVAGTWQFASGAHHATWFTANCTIEDGADPPRIRAMAFPAEAVEVLDTWDVSGMRATGSHDIRVAEVFVPAERMFDVFGESGEPGVLFRFPFGPIAQLSFAAVALGIARHALDAFPLEVGSARRERAHGLLEECEASLEVVRTRYFEEARGAWAAVRAEGLLTDDQSEAVRLASVRAARTSASVVEVLYLEAGLRPVFQVSELGRCWRDVHTVTQHISLSPHARDEVRF